MRIEQLQNGKYEASERYPDGRSIVTGEDRLGVMLEVIKDKYEYLQEIF